MASELEKRGVRLPTPPAMPVALEGIPSEMGFRAGWAVEEKRIVEVQSVAETLHFHKRQPMTHLCLSRLRRGLLDRLQVELIREGIVRIANGFGE